MTRVWLITGSARGLGRAIAEGVLAAGDKLIATARNPQQLSDLVARYGDHVRAVALDVTDERAAIAAVQSTVDVGRPVCPPSTGNIIAFSEVGGLHHRYERLAA